MGQVYNLVELFSGIGSQAMALKNIGAQVNLIGTCEWNIHAIVAYDDIHNGGYCPMETVENMSRETLIGHLSKYTLSSDGKTKINKFSPYSDEALRRILSAIIKNKNAVDVTMMNGENLPNGIDILTYSFPCQDLSNVGAFHGYNKGIDKDSGSRSALLWQVGRILSEMKSLGKKLPRFLMLENVPTLLSKRHKSNFEQWQKDLECLGYHNHVYKLNAINYGTPQNRPRLIMISILLEGQIGVERDKFVNKLEQFYVTHDISNKEYIRKLGIKHKKLIDLLKLDYGNQTLFCEACEAQPCDTPSRRVIWDDNPKLIDEQGNNGFDHIRTLTTKQDRNPNSGNIYFDYLGNRKAKYRFLTPRECFLLMGFREKDFENIEKNNFLVRRNTKMFARDTYYKLCGNSIPVKMLEQVFRQIIEIDEKIIARNKMCVTIR